MTDYIPDYMPGGGGERSADEAYIVKAEEKPKLTTTITPWRTIYSPEDEMHAPGNTFPWEQPGKVPQFSRGSSGEVEEENEYTSAWWNWEESYTAKVNAPPSAPSYVPYRPFEDMPSLAEGPYAMPDPDETAWDATWRGVQNRAWLVAEGVTRLGQPFVEATSLKETGKAYGEYLNYFVGDPVGIFKPKKEGQIRGALWTAAFDQVAIAFRNVTGMVLSLNERTGEISSTKAALLYTGNYEETIREMRGRSLDELESELRGMGVRATDLFTLRSQGLMQDWDVLKELGFSASDIRELRTGGQMDLALADEQLRTAAAEQAEFDRLMKKYGEEFGWGDFSREIPNARNRALRQTLMQKVLEELDPTSLESPRNFSDAFLDLDETPLERSQAYASGERSFPWSQVAQENYDMGKGFRWSHALNPGLAHAFESYVDSGMDIEDAAELTTDPLAEAVALMVMDPNWILQIDNLIMKPAVALVGPVRKVVGKVLGGVAKRVPILRGGYAWMIGITANTAGNRAVTHVEGAVRAARRYLTEQAIPISSDRIQFILKRPPEHFVAGIPRFIRRAIAGIHDDLPRIFEVGAGLFDEATVSAKMLDLDAAAAIPVMDEMFEAFMKKAKGTAYGLAKQKRFLENPWVDSKIVQKLFHNPLTKVITGLNSIKIDLWLGLRPSWSVFNAVDNTVKMVIDGVDTATSLKSIIERAGAYSPDLLDNLEAVRLLGDRKWWMGGTKRNREFVELLAKVSPGPALSTFSGELAKEGSILRKFPLIGPAIERGFARGNAIESIASLRTYYHHFFSKLDEGWGVLQKAGVDELLSQGVTTQVVESLRTKLSVLRNPTVETVNAVFDEFLSKNYTVTSNFNNGISDTLSSLSSEAKSRIQTVLDDLAITTPGNRVSAEPILDIFTKELNRITRDTYDNMQKATKALRDSLATIDLRDPGSLDSHLFRGIRPEDRVFEDYFRAMDDIPSITARHTLDRLEQNHAFAKQLYKDIDNPLTRPSPEEIGRRWDVQLAKDAREWNLWESSQAVFIDKFPDEVKEALARRTAAAAVEIPFAGPPSTKTYATLEEAAAARAASVAEVSPDIAELQRRAEGFASEFPDKFPSGAVQGVPSPTVVAEDPIPGLRQLGDDLKQVFSEYKDMKVEYRRLKAEAGRARRGFPSTESSSASLRADELRAKVKPLLSDRVHQNMVAYREWFITNGLDPNLVPSISDINKTGMADMFDNFIDDIETSSLRASEAKKADLLIWKEDALSTRTIASRNYPMTDEDANLIAKYREGVGGKVNDLVSDASEYGFQRRDELLFDYGTTSNFTSWLNNVVPFVRFPSKNLPLWINKFAEVPHLLGSVVKVRQIQAIINKDLPDRLKYTVGIPRALTDWLMEPLGFNNTQLRLNPWSYLSIFQQIPGGTPFRQAHLLSLYSDQEDRDLRDEAIGVGTVLKELGFGTWPYIEWFAGMQGLYGESWYPRDAYGTWAPVVNYVMNEIFEITGLEGKLQETTDFEASTFFDIDRQMRRNVPEAWNKLMGWAWPWKQLNPDMMMDWATGSEIQGLIMDLPQASLLTTVSEGGVKLAPVARINPSQVQSILAGISEEAELALRKQIAPIFKMSEIEQVEALAMMETQELAVFWDEMNLVAARKALQKRLFTTLVGNITGAYLEPVKQAEVEATKLRRLRRREKEQLEPGQETRDFTKQWGYEHPKYDLLTKWGYNQFPWAEGSAGREAEVWDALIEDAEDEYWQFNENWTAGKAKQIEEFYRANPGDRTGLRELNAKLRKEKEEVQEFYNERITTTIRVKMEDYIKAFPNDKQGKQMLEEGFMTDMYVAVELSPTQREQLRKFKEAQPNNHLGYNDFYQQLYNEAKKRRPPNQKKRWPGLNEGFKLDIRWNPRSYTEEEIMGKLAGDIYGKLSDSQPGWEEGMTHDAWLDGIETWRQTIEVQALATSEAQSQIELLMTNQGMTKVEAIETVGSWYTEQSYKEHWKQFTNPWSALDSVFNSRVISPISRYYWDEMQPIKDSDPELFRAMQAEFATMSRNVEATDLIRYILEEYPGRWTQAELEILFTGMLMPTYQETRVMSARGEKAVDAFIKDYYSKLDAEDRMTVRDALEPEFANDFLTGDKRQSIELKGEWLSAISGMVGEPMDWTTLPGTMELSQESGSVREAIDYGLPNVEPKHMEEYVLASEINKRYFEEKLSGENPELTRLLEQDPMRLKWFGKSFPQGYYYNEKNNTMPPGFMYWAFRDANPLIAHLDKPGVGKDTGTSREFDTGTKLIQEWVAENQEEMDAYGMDPAEWPQVRKEMQEYYSIPEEKVFTRKAYLEAHPLWARYKDNENAMYERLPTAKQFKYLEGQAARLEIDLPDDYLTWSMGEVSDAIDKYNEQIDLDTGEVASITSGQLSYITNLAERAGVEVPDDLANMTVGQAGETITKLKAELDVTGGIASKNQLSYIANMAEDLGIEPPKGLETLTASEASDAISQLKKLRDEVGTGGTGQMSQKQGEFIVSMLKRLELDIPEDLASWSSSRASDAITSLKGQLDAMPGYEGYGGGGGGGAPRDMSQSQYNYILSLMKQAGVDPPEDIETWSADQAGNAINELNEIVRKTGGAPKLMSANQKNYVVSLMKRAGVEIPEDIDTWTTQQASEAIDQYRGVSGGGSSYYTGGGRGWGGDRPDTPTVFSMFKDHLGENYTKAIQLLRNYWASGDLSIEVETYLKKIHAELGVTIDFKQWLGQLKDGYEKSAKGASRGQSTRFRVPKQVLSKAATGPRRDTSIRGRRTIEYQ